MALTLDQVLKVKNALTDAFKLVDGFGDMTFGISAVAGVEEGHAVCARAPRDITPAQQHQLKNCAMGVIGRKLDDDEFDVRNVSTNLARPR